MQRIISPLFLGVFLTLTGLLFSVLPGIATEEYAKKTGRICAACHLDPTGGGELTAAGTAFANTRLNKTAAPQATLLAKGFRLLIGYLHFLTAIFWFGTILYVHLVLKPAYAAGGLPRGEMRVGVVSMAVMGITGAILTWYRVDSAAILLHSRFGILLLVKVALYLVMVISSVIVIAVIGPRLKAKKREQPLVTSGDLTPAQLARCDGQEGHPAYLSYAGKIYDVTPSRLWKQGLHMGRHHAGTDLTEALLQAPHGQEKVVAMREVGALIATGPPKRALHERVFYFMAYMNLTIVLVITMILALWRWG
ncbi:MAG: cytochrome B5 [Desulfobulbaceae bacterium]|nr:cytochrome B5 [Desulfobulbaceae bacterium]